MDLSKIEKSVNKSKVLAVVLVVSVPAVYLIWFAGIKGYGVSLETGVWGAFGDFIGGLLNPIVGLFAFYWLTQSVLIQKTELSETKQALIDSSASQLQQSITQEKKRFEDTFFALLDQHNKVLEQLNLKKHERMGTMLFSTLELAERDVLDAKNLFSIKESRGILHRKYNTECGHYFRVLYQILKLIAVNCPNSNITRGFTVYELVNVPVTEEEKFYSNILRSFLGYNVTKLVAINSACEGENDSYFKYRMLIERYSFLEHMPIDYGFMSETINIYNSNAFGHSTFYKKYIESQHLPVI